MIRIIPASVLLVVCCLVGRASGETIIGGTLPDNATPSVLGSGYSVHWDDPQFVISGPSFQEVAVRFTPLAGQIYTLESLQLGVNLVAGFGGNLLQASVRSDAAGLPGTEIESFSLSGVSLSPAIVSLNSQTHPAFPGGTDYWLVARVAPLPLTMNAYWWSSVNPSPYGYTATRDPSNNDGNWVAHGNSMLTAFRLSGSAQPIPEPSALVLLLSAGCVAAARCWRRLSCG